MKSAAICLVVASLCCSGCMYKGNLKEGFYTPVNASSKLPIKAYLVFDRTIEGSVYHARNIFFSHGVDIETRPGLRSAMDSAFRSTFETLYTSSNIDPILINNYDVIVIPRIELIGNVITVSVTLKEAATDNIINTYKSSGNMYNTVPTSVHALAIINVIPFAGLATPIIAPINTGIIGGQAEKDLENVLQSSLGTITDDIRNDRSLVAKYKKDIKKI